MKTWKEKEKRFTEWLNELGMWSAVRKSRALRGERVEDIQWGPLSVELKTRKNCPPQYILDWLEQAHTNAEGRLGLVILHMDRTRMGEQVAFMRLNDLIALIKEVEEHGVVSKKEAAATADS